MTFIMVRFKDYFYTCTLDKHTDKTYIHNGGQTKRKMVRLICYEILKFTYQRND